MKTFEEFHQICKKCSSTLKSPPAQRRAGCPWEGALHPPNSLGPVSGGPGLGALEETIRLPGSRFSRLQSKVVDPLGWPFNLQPKQPVVMKVLQLLLVSSSQSFPSKGENETSGLHRFRATRRAGTRLSRIRRDGISTQSLFCVW